MNKKLAWFFTNQEHLKDQHKSQTKLAWTQLRTLRSLCIQLEKNQRAPQPVSSSISSVGPISSWLKTHLNPGSKNPPVSASQDIMTIDTHRPTLPPSHPLCREF